jgi:sulfur-oxidizing protein SoxX
MAGSRRSPPKSSVERIVGGAVVAAALMIGGSIPAAFAEAGLRPYAIVGDAIPDPLTAMAGDPARGRAIVLNRQVGLCLLCHSAPFSEAGLPGTLAPSIAGAGSRWSAGQLRLRLVDASRLNPDTIMPSYYRIDGLTRVAPGFAGKPILTEEQIEDVVAFLVTLRDEDVKER